MHVPSDHHFDYFLQFVICVDSSKTINVLVEDPTRVWAGITCVGTLFDVPNIMRGVGY